MNQPKKIIAIVPAAGIGARMRAAIPKQYLKIAGKTILEHTIDRLTSHSHISEVVVALHPEDAHFSSLEVANNIKVRTVTGGKERADSVLNALNTVPDEYWVMVHDAARPCLSHADVDALLNLTERSDVIGGILATPVRDTMKRAVAGDSKNVIAHTESRENLWHALTPQMFPARDLKLALTDALKQGAPITDEASAMELAGHRVALINGNPTNIKVTQPEDMTLATLYLTQQDT